jgi:hypothetical protein
MRYLKTCQVGDKTRITIHEPNDPYLITAFEFLAHPHHRLLGATGLKAID